jgi:hypothetical protein
MNRHYRVLLITTVLAAAASVAAAQPGNDIGQQRMFGKGHPFFVGDLPPGRTREKLESLPAPARSRAMEWLHSFAFPAKDLDVLIVTDEGDVLYADPTPPELPAEIERAPEADGASPEPSASAADDAFALHSNPGAPNVVYLDFDGHVVSGTAWGGGTLYARPYDADGDPATFSQAERGAIAEIWHRVAEDFAPFDVDVTTEEPAQFNATTGRILITRDDDEFGTPMPYAGAGGVAYVNVWGRTGTYDYPYYSPAFVYYENLGNGQPRYVAEAASHEFGHNLALAHDGTSTVTYYSGHNAGPSAGYIDWAPIMGNSYGADVSQWSRGDYADANNQQDDLLEIANRLNYRFDDHADTQSQATPLAMDGSGNVVSTNPELDPFNVDPDNKGVIEDSDDVDYFVLNLGTGTVNLTLHPAWDAFHNDASRGANLDLHVALYGPSGALVAEDNPATDTGGTLLASVSAGTYYLAVTGVGAGDPQTAYDAYGSIGQYFINGSVPIGTPNDAPIAVDDNATASEDGIVVLAVLANDSDPEGDTLTIVSMTQPAHGFAAINDTTITYTPAANYHGNDAFAYTISDGLSTSSANVILVVNPVNDAPVAHNDGATTTAGTPVAIEVLANDIDPDGDGLTITGSTQPANGSVSIRGASVDYTPNGGFIGTDGFQYTVGDGAGGTATATVAVTVEYEVIVPEAPANISAVDSGTGIALLTWSASAGADGYEIRRETRHKKRDTWNGTATVGTANADTTSFNDTSGAGTFRYQVRAVSSAGSSNWSPWAVVTVTDSSGGGGRGGGNKGQKK